MDVGEYTPGLISNTKTPTGMIESTEQKELRILEQIIGSRTVTGKALEMAPGWLLENALAAEMVNWKGAYEIVGRRELPNDANVIYSHVL